MGAQGILVILMVMLPTLQVKWFLSSQKHAIIIININKMFDLSRSLAKMEEDWHTEWLPPTFLSE